MASSITRRQQQSEPSRPRLMAYSEIFSASGTIEERILLAVLRLSAALQTAITEGAQQAWTQSLSRYSTAELVRAFERTEGEVSAFPAVAHLVQFIEKARFRAAFATVLRGLSKHGVDWQRIPGERVKDATQPDGWRIVSYPVELPALPRRIVQALEYFGQDGTLRGGLVRLKRDAPQFWTGETEYTTGQHGRQASMIERDLWDAWKEADGE